MICLGYLSAWQQILNTWAVASGAVAIKVYVKNRGRDTIRWIFKTASVLSVISTAAIVGTTVKCEDIWLFCSIEAITWGWQLET